MPTFTFFELASAARQIRPLKFTGPSSEVIAIPTLINNSSRDGRTWSIGTSGGGQFVWHESNTLPVMISEVAGSVVRAPAHFSYFDLLAAIRGIRTMKFTTGGNVVLAVPTGLMNHSRNSSVFTVTTTGGTFEWADDNSGPTVISEV